MTLVKEERTLSNEVKEKLKLENLHYTDRHLKRRYNSFYNRFVKRTIDLVIAIIALAILWPLVLIIAIAVVIDNGFPVFYCPLRGGYKNKPFHIVKFRTMVRNADKIGGGTTALHDSRITRVGAFLRKTKLDEIAQLFNILNGTMSFVGPRPELLRYTEQYEGQHKNILNVRPGITDFSSINFISLDEIVGNQNADEMYEKYVLKKKNELRLKYVAKVSFVTDAEIFLTTVAKVFEKALRVIRKK